MSEEKSKPVVELVEQAMKNYEQALKTGLRVQEESAKWCIGVLSQCASAQDWQKRVKGIAEDVLPQTQKSVEESLKLVEKNSRTALELLKKAAAAAQSATPQEAQKARHEHYEQLGDAFKAVRDNVRGDTPDWAALQKAAQTIADASVDQQKWFAKGTGPESGKTRALPEIWSKPDAFTAAQKMLSDRAPKLLAAVKSKDAPGVQAAFKDVGGACKNCHDTFRAPEDK